VRSSPARDGPRGLSVSARTDEGHLVDSP